MTRGAPFEIEWAPTALRGLERLPEKVATAVVEFVYGAISAGHALRFELEGLHSANRGDYRVVYRIDEEAGEIVILVVDHRSRIYRSR